MKQQRLAVKLESFVATTQYLQFVFLSIACNCELGTERCVLTLTSMILCTKIKVKVQNEIERTVLVG